jgi:ribosomal protein S18 acetylase RimI-like enzyme
MHKRSAACRTKSIDGFRDAGRSCRPGADVEEGRMSVHEQEVAVPGGGLRWVRDEDPRWDEDRVRVFGTIPAEVFPQLGGDVGRRLSSDWWRVVDARSQVVGFGWLDDVWGDAEVLIAVDAGARSAGVGSFALAHLEAEASARGLNYVVNVVRTTHSDRASVMGWFLRRGFTATDDGALRKRVGGGQVAVGQRQDGAPGARRAPAPDPSRRTRYQAARNAVSRPTRDAGSAPVHDEPLGPGHEESGGYVDPEHHRY